ncbi:unnamed protein product [Choristocarpus tenellus]
MVETYTLHNTHHWRCTNGCPSQVMSACRVLFNANIYIYMYSIKITPLFSFLIHCSDSVESKICHTTLNMCVMFDVLLPSFSLRKPPSPLPFTEFNLIVVLYGVDQAVQASKFHLQYPLMASSSDDGTIHVFHATVYSDLLRNPLVVPLKILRGHEVSESCN